MRKILIPILALGLGACGEMAEMQQEQDRGGLNVVFKALAGVDKVKVEWYGGPEVGHMNLTDNGDGTYTGNAPRLLVGSYFAVATAYDVDKNVLFKSQKTNFEVKHNDR